jgi:hypothetical protein
VAVSSPFGLVIYGVADATRSDFKKRKRGQSGTFRSIPHWRAARIDAVGTFGNTDVRGSSSTIDTGHF